MTHLKTVFVYGTLKRDEPNYHWLTNRDNGEAKYLGTATTLEKYPLVIASRYNIPYLLGAPGIGHNVEGEVYQVDETMLGNLDILEDHPKYYERKICKVKMNGSDDEIDVWIYLLHQFKEQMLQLPFLKSYQSDGEHGLRYVARYLRKNPKQEYWTDVKKTPPKWPEGPHEDDISDPEDI